MVTNHTVTYCLKPEETVPMTTWWTDVEGTDRGSWRPTWDDPSWRGPGAWGPTWEAWVSGLAVSSTCPLQYALLHLLRYDREPGLVPITNTTRFFMRYVTPREWQGSREEYLWCIEQYLNWLGVMYGGIGDWTAWAVPAMFTQGHMDVLHREDARYEADVVTCTAWQVTPDEDDDESDDASSESSGG